jgi:hypothetical protein
MPNGLTATSDVIASTLNQRRFIAIDNPPLPTSFGAVSQRKPCFGRQTPSFEQPPSYQCCINRAEIRNAPLINEMCRRNEISGASS